MRRLIAVFILATGALLAASGIARAQFTEQIDGYDVRSNCGPTAPCA
jgi:hypothetical protein